MDFSHVILHGSRFRGTWAWLIKNRRATMLSVVFSLAIVTSSGGGAKCLTDHPRIYRIAPLTASILTAIEGMVLVPNLKQGLFTSPRIKFAKFVKILGCFFLGT